MHNLKEEKEEIHFGLFKLEQTIEEMSMLDVCRAYEYLNDSVILKKIHKNIDPMILEFIKTQKLYETLVFLPKYKIKTLSYSSPSYNNNMTITINLVTEKYMITKEKKKFEFDFKIGVEAGLQDVEATLGSQDVEFQARFGANVSRIKGSYYLFRVGTPERDRSKYRGIKLYRRADKVLLEMKMTHALTKDLVETTMSNPETFYYCALVNNGAFLFDMQNKKMKVCFQVTRGEAMDPKITIKFGKDNYYNINQEYDLSEAEINSIKRFFLK